MNLKKLTIAILALFMISIIGCEEDTTGEYSKVFDTPPQKSIEEIIDKPKVNTPVKKKPKPVIKKQPKVDKDEKFRNMLLSESAKWLEVVDAIEETVKQIYTMYFNNEGSYGNLKSGQNFQEIYENLGKKVRMPRLVNFKSENITLSKLMTNNNRMMFNVLSEDKDSMKFDICPKWARISYPSYIEQIRTNAAKEYNRDFEKYLWLEAKTVLLGMQIGFMFFLFENKYTEFDNITYPMNLTDLAQLIDYDEGTFRKLRFFKDTDFKLKNFNFKSREFLMTANTTGKFPSPKSGIARIFNRTGWYHFKPKVVEPEIKVDDPNPENKDENKVENPKDIDDDNEKPNVKNPKRLPSINGKKVKLEVEYNFNLLRKKNFVYEKMLEKIPAKPYDFEERFEEVLEDMGAKVVTSGYDAKVVVKIDIEVDLTTWMEEVFNLILYGKMKVTSTYGEKENSFNGSFNERDNDMERCFKSIWDDSEAKFRQIVSYAFLKE